MSRHAIACDCDICEAREAAYIRAVVVYVLALCILVLVAVR